MLQLQIEEHASLAIIHLDGTMNSESMEEFEENYSQALKEKPEVLALDFKNVQWIDSFSINHLFKLSKITKKMEVEFVIYEASPQIKEILDVIKLNKIITIISEIDFEKIYLRTF